MRAVVDALPGLLVGDAARRLSSGFSPTYGATFSPLYPVALVLPALYAFGVWLYLRNAALVWSEGTP